MNKINPFCSNCSILLKYENVSSTVWEYYNCVKCKNGEAKLIGKWLPTDDDTNLLFYDIAKKLRNELDITIKEAIGYTEDFYSKFTDKEFCDSLGVEPFDDDFFHHEYFRLLFYISYFIIKKKEKNLEKFREWYFENK